MNLKQHWDKVYTTKSDQDVGWYQENPELSLKLIRKYVPEKDALIIDVGSGNSHLSKILFDQGYPNLTILDISTNALFRSKYRFKDDAEKLTFIESNILDFNSNKPFEIWHDRAVFHFLIDQDDINKYTEVAAKNIASGGYLILGTFSVTGPETCSGLPITQYNKEKLIKVFHSRFNLIESFEDIHLTPTGNPQNFIWAVLKRK